MKDEVKCMNCGWTGFVSSDDEVCPSCKMCGSLAWKDECDEIEVK